MIKNLIFDLGGVVLPLNPEQAWTRFESLGIKNTRQQMGVYGQTGIFRQLEDGSIRVEYKVLTYIFPSNRVLFLTNLSALPYLLTDRKIYKLEA